MDIQTINKMSRVGIENTVAYTDNTHSVLTVLQSIQ